MLRRLAPITVLSPCMAAWFEHNRLTAVFTSKDLAMGKLPELRAYNGSVSHVSLYSYSLGKINSNFSLQDQPYGHEFTRAVHDAGIAHVSPIINCGGPNAESDWKHAATWTRVFVDEAVKWNYSGYTMDMEISKSSSASTQQAFLNHFADGLRAVNPKP